MVFTQRPFLVLISFCCLESLRMRNSFVFEPVDPGSLIFPPNCYWNRKLKSTFLSSFLSICTLLYVAKQNQQAVSTFFLGISLAESINLLHIVQCHFYILVIKEFTGKLIFKRGGNGCGWVSKNLWLSFICHNPLSGYKCIPLTWKTHPFSSKTIQVSPLHGIDSNSRILSSKSGPCIDEALWVWSLEYGSSWPEELWIKKLSYYLLNTPNMQ